MSMVAEGVYIWHSTDVVGTHWLARPCALDRDSEEGLTTTVTVIMCSPVPAQQVTSWERRVQLLWRSHIIESGGVDETEGSDKRSALQGLRETDNEHADRQDKLGETQLGTP